jgi:hypothetical protein
MYARGMSEWNYTKCAKPFDSQADAETYMLERDFAGYVLKRLDGYTSVCPTYPDGYYPDGVKVAEVENSLGELRAEELGTNAGCC